MNQALADKARALHPYIVAQQRKKLQHAQKPSGNNQAVSSTASSSHTQLRCGSQSIPRARCNRKRKYIDTFEDDEDGQRLYSQSLIVAPPSKQHISEQTVMKSISMLQRMSLNQYSGALVPYKKPMASKSWQELIQTYYKNNKHCNVKQFTEMHQDEDIDGDQETDAQPEPEDVDATDCEMAEHAKLKTKSRRPIRLHSSYSGFAANGFIKPEKLKKIANQCYVSSVGKANSSKQPRAQHPEMSDKELETDSQSMDCD
jgi:hypothetical protein